MNPDVDDRGVSSALNAVPRTTLVTGVAGQDGVYLSRLLMQRGYHVVGLVRPGPAPASVSAYLQGASVLSLDICDGDGMAQLLDDLKPRQIYNLAGFSSVGASWNNAETVAEINGMSVLRLLELLLRFRDKHGWAPRFYQASSSEMFGLAAHQPQGEDTAHHPRSPYAAAKSFAHNLTINYRESYGLYACSGILFNHESPLRPERFVTRKITRGVAEIAQGQRSSITLGNLDVKRDWGAAQDYVEAMWLMMQRETPDDFVVATGTSRSLMDVVRAAFEAVGMDDGERYIETDPSLQRPADVPETRGDASKAEALLGWRPRIGFSEMIEQMVWADVKRLRSGWGEHPSLMGPSSAVRDGANEPNLPGD